MMRRSWMALALTVSLAFNVGFAGILAARYVGSRVRAASSPAAGADRMHEFCRANDRVKGQLQSLRLEQAALTGRLAVLVTAPESDRGEIDACLDRLALTGRRVRGLVVDAVLAQRDALPEARRTEFADYVHRRMCGPWISCGYEAACCKSRDRKDVENEKGRDR